MCSLLAWLGLNLTDMKIELCRGDSRASDQLSRVLLSLLRESGGLHSHFRWPLQSMVVLTLLGVTYAAEDRR